MFVKVSTFYFGDAVGPVLWIGGAAVLLAAAGLLLYFRTGRPAAAKGRPNRFFFRRAAVFGLLLIAAGLLAQKVFSRSSVLDERYAFRAPVKDEIGRVYYQPAGDRTIIPLKEMIRKPAYKILKEPERIQMNRNGFIETPFCFFSRGRFILEFAAEGTDVRNQRSRILVAFLVLGPDGAVLAGDPAVYELTPENEKYAFALPEASGRLGAVRIEFLNSVTSIKGQPRVVTVSDVVLRKAGES